VSGALGVLVDGEAMPAGEARDFWQRFSAYMEEHKGDLAGFAKQEGFASVHPSMKDGAAVLLVSRTSAQRPYVSVGKGEKGETRGGSSDHQAPSRDPARGGKSRRKGSKRRR
jgi:hypothetical protein